MTELEQQLIALYQEMYELTSPECGGSCTAPRTCCHDSHCDMAAQWAEEMWGIKLEPTGHKRARAKFLDENGCVVPPHLRPICTLHTCSIMAFGFKRDDDAEQSWTKRYFALRSKIEEVETKWCDESYDPATAEWCPAAFDLPVKQAPITDERLFEQEDPEGYAARKKIVADILGDK